MGLNQDTELQSMILTKNKGRDVTDPRNSKNLAVAKPQNARRDSFYLKSNTTKIRDIGGGFDIHITDLSQNESKKTPRVEKIKIPEIDNNMIEGKIFNNFK